MVSSKHHFNDTRFMRMALMLAQRELGNTWPNPAVGAVISSPEGIILGRGWTQPGGRPHAEPHALKQAGKAARGATLYVTLEPCSHHGKTSPCAEAIIKAGISRVVSAMEDPDSRVAGRGHAMLRTAGIEVTTGIMEAQARRAHAGHILRITQNRPFVLLKMALSANEKIALPDGSPVQITSALSLRHVHMLRARTDAIAVGIGTVLSDDPLLTCRLPGMENRSPVRMVFDSRLRIPLTSRLVASSTVIPLWIITGADASTAQETALKTLGVDIFRLDNSGIGSALNALAECGITRLMVEGGPILASNLLNARMVDEVAIFQSSQSLPANALPVFDTGVQTMLSSNGFSRIESYPSGGDMFSLYGKVLQCSPD
jgi:diaminohydroxyphosphoribosylaminopyrimidine deaminase / 5-amino-6-(5-phosphoribosylamino)uracil reductase